MPRGIEGNVYTSVHMCIIVCMCIPRISLHVMCGIYSAINDKGVFWITVPNSSSHEASSVHIYNYSLTVISSLSIIACQASIYTTINVCNRSYM